MENSTGIPQLDELLQGINLGDNIVWQVNEIQDYFPFVEHFTRYANRSKKNLVYIRFGQHQRVLHEHFAATVITINPNEGFEAFITQIFQIVNQKGPNVYYVFDMLNDLVVDWYSDIMVANFFMLVCPYLRKARTVAYFAMKRSRNASHSLKNIHFTAQIVINVYPKLDAELSDSQNEKKLQNFYLYPLKVEDRHSSTIHMLHYWKRYNSGEEKLRPIRESGIISRILKDSPLPELNFTVRRMDSWFLEFKKAQDALMDLSEYHTNQTNMNILKNKLLQMVLSDDDRIRILAIQYLELEDLVKIGKRMIGTGRIGGKSTGLLLARAILRKNRPNIFQKLEKHDSFFIGSHLYYTFLIRNECWEDRKNITLPHTFLQGLHNLEQKILNGIFERYILRQFREMLNYFGQSPIVVRSSSLQEDAYGNSFSGKYATIFCPNQGTPEERLGNFVKAVKAIYASSISEEALLYRKDKGLLDTDEEMALLVQRVSGTDFGDMFLPHLAGVGFSYNPFVWNEKIDPKAGFVRLVFGLGTRAVDRTGDDFARLIALNAPSLRTSHNLDEIRKYSQKKVDLLSLTENIHKSIPYHQLFKKYAELPNEFFVTNDLEADQRARKIGLKDSFTGILTLDPVLQNSDLIQDLREILMELQNAYLNPVDIEFTANFRRFEKYSINLLQCRPFHVSQDTVKLEKPQELSPNNLILRFKGPIIGTSRIVPIDRIIFVSPAEYSKLSIQDKYAIARLLGQINLSQKTPNQQILLLGPGRWGTSSPSLGVPVSFEEINKVTILGEIAEMHKHLIPDISLGTHFFNNIVENDMLYFALNPEKGNVQQNSQFFDQSPNFLKILYPTQAKWANVVKIIDFPSKSFQNNSFQPDIPDKASVDDNIGRVIFYGDAHAQFGQMYIKSKKIENS
ncbi:MAG: PEP/pyruvate-binding domain-containing protein [Promethearchaeota archaeon]